LQQQIDFCVLDLFLKQKNKPSVDFATPRTGPSLLLLLLLLMLLLIDSQKKDTIDRKKKVIDRSGRVGHKNKQFLLS